METHGWFRIPENIMNKSQNTPQHTPMISIVGLSGSGKTALVVKLISLLTEKGMRVATIKHSCHPHPLDAPGKDSHRHKEAGAERVLFIGPKALQLVADVEGEPTPESLAGTYLSGMDLIIVEGFIQSRTEKIEVVRSERSKRPVSSTSDGLIAIATDMDPGDFKDAGVPVLDLNSVEAIADFITNHVSISSPPTSTSASTSTDNS